MHLAEYLVKLGLLCFFSRRHQCSLNRILFVEIQNHIVKSAALILLYTLSCTYRFGTAVLVTGKG